MSFQPSKKRGAIADINITPLVDILLVLLIIFMVTAPMVHHGTQIQTPDVSDSKGSQAPTQKEEKATLIITAKQEIFFRDKKMDKDRLFQFVLKDPQLQKNQELYIQGDPSLSYGVIMDVMGMIQRAGIKKVGIVVSPEDVQ